MLFFSRFGLDCFFFRLVLLRVLSVGTHWSKSQFSLLSSSPPPILALSLPLSFRVINSGKLLIPQIEVLPTAVIANHDKPPELEIRFDMEPSVPPTNLEDDPTAPLPINWQLRFLHNQLFHLFEYPSRFCPVSEKEEAFFFSYLCWVLESGEATTTGTHTHTHTPDAMKLVFVCVISIRLLTTQK